MSYLHFSSLCLYHPLWDFYSNTVVSHIHFLYFVCIILCEIFILTLFCHTYIFLQLVCIILCEIFIQTLVYPTLFAPQWLTNRITTWAAFFFNWFVSSVVRFLFKHCFTPPFCPIVTDTQDYYLSCWLQLKFALACWPYGVC